MGRVVEEYIFLYLRVHVRTYESLYEYKYAYASYVCTESSKYYTQKKTVPKVSHPYYTGTKYVSFVQRAVRACLNPPPKSTGTSRMKYYLPDELVPIGC